MRWQTTVVLVALLVALGVFYWVWEVQLGPERERAEARRGRVVPAEPSDVVGLEIRRGDERLRLERQGDGWQLLEPVRARGDRGRIEDVVTTLVTARVEREVVAQPAALAEFGLDRPAAEVTLRVAGGQQYGFLLGARSPTGSWVYARHRDRPAVVLLPEAVLRHATLPVSELRDRTVLALDRKAVSGLEIVLPDETLAVEHAGGRWRLTRPRALEADAEAIGEFLDKLAAARVKAFVAEAPPSLAPWGLDRPVRVLIHVGQDRERATRTLLFGRLEPAQQGVYAMRPGEGSVLLLPEDLWAALPRTVGALRDRTLVAFERERVTRLDLESPRGQVTAVRSDGRWRLTRPEDLPADPVEVGGVLMRLRTLRAQAFLTEDASGIARYLARPEVRATLTIEGAPAPLTVLLAPSPERRGGRPSAYAAVEGRGPVVLVEASALAEIGRSADELRDRTLLGGFEPRAVTRVAVRAGGRTVVAERAGEGEWRLREPTRGPARAAPVENLLWALRGLKWSAIVSRGGEAPARWGLDAPSAEITLYRADGTVAADLQVGRQEGDRRYVRLKPDPVVYAVEAKRLPVPSGPEEFAP